MITCENIICQLVDSAADSKLKRLKPGETFGVEKPGGEARIYVGQTSNEKDFDEFFGFNKSDYVQFKVFKSDLLAYLIKAKDEFLNPKESYRLDISQFYNAFVAQTLGLQEEFTIEFKKNTDKRYYISPIIKGGNLYGKYIRGICLPLLTRYNFIKATDEAGNISYYFKLIFNNSSSNNKQNVLARPALDEPLQLIFYGAPGTGKSFKIDGMTSDANTVRTTFHPDSDYSSFVGAYKPTMQPMPIHAFVGTTVHKAKTADNAEATEKKIVYKYVPQAFMKAYVEAWKDLDNPHFLVIEEINRGNCAQIFGDLFQLLDRNAQGCSSYAIHADEDISQFLSSDDNGFANLPEETSNAIRRFVLHKDNGKTEEIGAAILAGKKLLLPPNLYIWATMNTSDQSLFPIDSAFKRRWNWEYIPIRFFENDTDPSLTNRSFEVNGTLYSWADFLRKINPIISELTESADKQMGFFFAKPDKKSDPQLNDNDVISEKVFLNKVLFYLWTDVLKDYNIGREEFKKPDGDGKPLEFADFFEESQNYLAQFVAKLGIDEIAAYDDARP